MHVPVPHASFDLFHPIDVFESLVAGTLNMLYSQMQWVCLHILTSPQINLLILIHCILRVLSTVPKTNCLQDLLKLDLSYMK